ncbi:hypothetical protein P7D31_00700 [Enterococcus dongliensis]|jgi:hypothetical protein|uniref:hypothetical protein n=1 Tax=Enterococcus TaxID=1350 RepID=UPI002890AB57|nr:hypothetical protein [Enterococcus dongliensis]MDT2638634.1 hypothetical protein [Enterococcus dongliensis]
MENKMTVSDVIKYLSAPVFAAMSYIIAERWQISNAIFKFSDPKVHITVSVGIYTAIMNLFFLWALSKRTTVSSKVKDRKDQSNKIKIDEKPRKIEVEVEVTGNTNNIDEIISIVFPEWIDVSTKAVPDIKADENNPNQYNIKLSNIVNYKEVRSYFFDINLKTIYAQTNRVGMIKATCSGNFWRYQKKDKDLQIQYVK